MSPLEVRVLLALLLEPMETRDLARVLLKSLQWTQVAVKALLETKHVMRVSKLGRFGHKKTRIYALTRHGAKSASLLLGELPPPHRYQFEPAMAVTAPASGKSL